MNARRVGDAIVPALIATVAAAIAVVPRPDHTTRARPSGPPPPPAAPCAPDVIAALGNVHVGTTFGEWTIVGVRCAEPRRADIGLVHGVGQVTVTVAARDLLPYNPPARTAHYDIFFQYATPTPASDAQIRPLIQALATHLQTAEATTSPPSGW